jgi:hypothetical protein
MAEICIEIPDSLKNKIDAKIGLFLLVKRLVKHLEEEQEMIDWSVKLQRASRKERFNELNEII